MIWLLLGRVLFLLLLYLFLVGMWRGGGNGR